MAVSPNHVPSIPDCSIEGIKPRIEAIDPIQMQLKPKPRWGELKTCCICDNAATKVATYHVQGAIRIERYCDKCAEKQFSRSEV